MPFAGRRAPWRLEEAQQPPRRDMLSAETHRFGRVLIVIAVADGGHLVVAQGFQLVVGLDVFELPTE